MKVAVVGASGTLGRAIVDGSKRRGHETIAVTRRPPKQPFLKVEQRTADVLSGEGLAKAFAGADVVLNAVNAERGAKELLVDGTRRLIEAASEAGVGHYVATSIVGIEKVPLAYYMVKVQEEELVMSLAKEKKIGWSILRATQFHDLVDDMFMRTSRFGVLLAPPGAKLQPIDHVEVAEALVMAAEKGPQERLPDLGGPEVLLLRDLANQWLKATRKMRLIMPTPVPGALGRGLREGALCAPDRALGKKTFATYLAERYAG